MDIQPLDLEDAAQVAEAHAIGVAANERDVPWLLHPGLINFAGMLRHGFDGEAPVYVVGRDHGRIVATGSIWASELDNLDLAWLGVQVHPDHRRRGHGQAMLEHLEATSVAMGRHSVGLDCWESQALTEPLARRGYPLVFTSVCRRLTLDAQAAARGEAAYEQAQAAPRAGDYELVRVAGALPDELMEASLAARVALNDAPTEDLDIEDEIPTPERVRAYEHAHEVRGMRIYQVLAIHRETGAGAGHTIVAVDRERGMAAQHDTSVVPAHRGHRLGLALKAEMLRLLAADEPELGYIDTFNAQSNEHMVAVNDALGFVAMGRELSFQRTLTAS